MDRPPFECSPVAIVVGPLFNEDSVLLHKKIPDRARNTRNLPRDLWLKPDCWPQLCTSDVRNARLEYCLVILPQPSNSSIGLPFAKDGNRTTLGVLEQSVRSTPSYVTVWQRPSVVPQPATRGALATTRCVLGSPRGMTRKPADAHQPRRTAHQPHHPPAQLLGGLRDSLDPLPPIQSLVVPEN
jgi:hypothetical protein